MRKAWAAGVVAAVACAACVHQKDPSVQVKDLQADIVFGLTPTTTEAPIVPVVAPPPPVGQNAPQELATPYVVPFNLGLNLNPPKSKCPAAALDAFPSQTAPIGVSSPPIAGAYTWELGGGIVRGVNFTLVNGSETRLVRRVATIGKLPTDAADSTDFSFQTIEPADQKGDVLLLTYRVRSHNLAQVYEQPPAGTEKVYAPTPDAGLSLVSEDRVDAQGGTSPVFHPSEPLLLLPMPLQPGAQFISVAADPSSGQVVTFQGSVVRRARVDACGTIIEGWEVHGLERSVAPPPPSNGAPTLGAVLGAAISGTSAADVDSIYATQFGGLLLAEHTLQATLLGTVSVDDAIGQEKPSPLPPGTS